ncbi:MULTISPECIES: lipoprotein insertase outer membrane protein LolB [unclassified Agarivorans]|uniref:lipoprotein insertase outer membrane protein LolB n=1 Tax=unclassified Agarivorans TaxID=2636026 RepID=UPI0026E361F6|nr:MULTISPECIES: lipoprotein insertase outer membrane protein LolB [unclassified Agarivorans]MDO6686091.1 lipoprotein insertase outer membrane protein LolB [Agarivorans sp. 3_MG-2023]MDO6717712.1 lipoprotein insertase outer membrane protein LolB [Agarivorans sp. 2_MG-2023]
MRQLVFIIIFAMSLTACTIAPPISTENSEWDSHLADLNRLNNWQLSGKIAFISDASRQAANLYWQQQGDKSILRINGPLGIQGIELHYQPGKVWVKTKDEEYSGKDAQLLVHRLTGWQVPVEQLPKWLLGIPTQNDYQLNPQHRLAGFTTDEQWEISYVNYAQYNTHTLPRQLEMRSTDNLLKLNIHKWQINDSTSN